MICTHSRIAVTGLRYDAPCQRSTITGLETPRPAIARPPESSLSAIASIASTPGVRIWIGTTPVAKSTRRVAIAHGARATKALGPATSATHNDAYPPSSASCESLPSDAKSDETTDRCNPSLWFGCDIGYPALMELRSSAILPLSRAPAQAVAQVAGTRRREL